MKNEIIGHKPSAARHNLKLLTGTTTDKYAVVLDGGKTIVFISDKSKEEETRQKYMMRAQNNNIK